MISSVSLYFVLKTFIIFGPTRRVDGYWRIKINQEINEILKGQNIIGFIKKQRLNWLGNVEGIIIIFINCNWVVTRWQYTLTHKNNIEQHN